MNIDHALTVEGWMTEPELGYLARAASKSRTVAEVGSWMGRSTSALAANTHGIVIAVDTWRGSQEHAPMLKGKPEGWLLGQFTANMDPFYNVWPVQMNSRRAAGLIARGPLRFDLIFLDASHDYESVKNDILSWMPLLSPGGILCGHDYDPPNWMGIKQAVEECVPRFEVVPGTTIWTTEGM